MWTAKITDKKLITDSGNPNIQLTVTFLSDKDVNANYGRNYNFANVDAITAIDEEVKRLNDMEDYIDSVELDTVVTDKTR